MKPINSFAPHFSIGGGGGKRERTLDQEECKIDHPGLDCWI